MKYRNWLDFGATLFMGGCGMLLGLSREQAWGFVLVGAAVMLAALVASFVSIRREMRVVGATKQAEQAGASRLKVITTTIREEEP